MSFIIQAKLVLTLEKIFHKLPLLSIEIDHKVQDPPETKKYSWLFRQWRKVYDSDEMEEQLQAMIDQKENKDDYGKQLDELREEIKRMKELIQEKL